MLASSSERYWGQLPNGHPLGVKPKLVKVSTIYAPG
jgi:hypothetical protein